MKNKLRTIKNIPGRYIFLLLAILVMFTGMVARLSYLHVVQQEFLRKQGDARTKREIKIAAYRGMIKDRNGESLAISTPVDSVWINPKELDLQSANLKHLAKYLNVPLKNIYSKATAGNNAHKEFVYLKRHIDPKLGKKIKALQIAGVHLQPEYRRYYPSGEVTSQVLGLTNIDHIGLEGLEYAYNTWLAGKPGKRVVEKDRVGREVESLSSTPEIPGNDLTLSIDSRLQYLAYKALKAAVKQHRANSGSAVVLDVRTGEVLAMVNDPSFNPNNRERDKNAIYRNVAVTDAFEPGSVLKTFSMTSVLEHIKVNPNMLIDIAPGYIKLPGGVVREDHYNSKTLEVSSVLKESSNIGITKLVLNIKPSDLINTYRNLGFGAPTASGFPGENSGYITNPREDQLFVQATMSFGYGITVTPLQLAQAYAIIGAGGIKRPVSFLKIADESEVTGVRVLKSNVARQVLDLLTVAVNHERSNAKVSGYRVAGKTGTARKVGKSGYDRHKHRALFGGLAPAINPRVAIVVAIDEPRGGEVYGNQVAAPVFSKIASGALRLFKIAPDLLDTHGVHVASTNNGNKY